MKRIGGLLFFFFASLLVLPAEPFVITVADFLVESRNPSYEFLGKGLSRLVASELRKSAMVKLTERENLQKLLEEQEFSLSDLADSATQLKLGTMLSAKYVVLGEIIDMASVVLLSLRMVDVETGQIVWQDELQEKLASYDYIGAYFADSILKTLGAGAADSTLAKLGKKEEKKEAAIVMLSEGIDAFDKGDKTKARKDLKKVKNLDPVNEVAREYLSKLESVSPKFRVETELYSSSYNPASLGFLQEDALFFWWSALANPPGVTIHPERSEDQLSGDFWASNFGNSLKLGYAFPLGSRMGMMTEVVVGGYRWLAEPVSDAAPPFDYGSATAEAVKDSFTNTGAALSFGGRVIRNVSLGGTVMLWNTVKGPGDVITVDPGMYWAAGGGVMFKGLEDAFTLDIDVMYTNQSMYYVDIDSWEIVEGDMPLLAEASLTYELLDQLLFLGLKGIGNIYLDPRGGHALRVIPVVEYRPLRFLSIRAGYEYSHFNQAGEFTMGHGFLAGLTARIWRFDFNVNATYSHIPARILPGHTMEYLTFLIGSTFTPVWSKR